MTMKKILGILVLVLLAGGFWFLGNKQGRQTTEAVTPSVGPVGPPTTTAPMPPPAAPAPAPAPAQPGMEPPPQMPGLPPALAQQYLESRARNRETFLLPYDMLLQDLGIEGPARAQAMEAIKEYDERMAELMAASMPPNGKPPTVAQLQAHDRERDAKLRSALGEEGFVQYQANNDTIPERLALAKLENRMEGAGVPLSDQQTNELLTAMVEAARTTSAPLPSTAPDPGQASTAPMTRNDPSKRFEAVSAALINKASGFTPDQQALINQFITETQELRRTLPGGRPGR